MKRGALTELKQGSILNSKLYNRFKLLVKTLGVHLYSINFSKESFCFQLNRAGCSITFYPLKIFWAPYE